MRRAWASGLSVVVLLIVIGALTPSDPNPATVRLTPATTYSSAKSGAKAMFLLFEKTRLYPSRMRRATYSQLDPSVVLWMLGSAPLTRLERRELIRFIHLGGTVVSFPNLIATGVFKNPQEATREGLRAEETEFTQILCEKKLNTTFTSRWGHSLVFDRAPCPLKGPSAPERVFASNQSGEPLVASWKIGKGHVVSLGAEDMVRNEHIGKKDHGPFLVRLAYDLGSHHSFDEFITGFAEKDLRTFVSHLPYKWGLLQLALASLVGILALFLHRFPSEELLRVKRRRTLDHVDAVAHLWSRSKAATLPLEAIVARTAEKANQRLGGIGYEESFVRWVERMKPALVPRARAAWASAQELIHSKQSSVEEARKVAAEIKRIEQEARS